MQRKDKRLRCIKCGRGGHDAATCLNRIHLSKYCHVCCKFVDDSHDPFGCADRAARCDKCNMIGHNSEECSTTRAQKAALAKNAWDIDEPGVICLSSWEAPVVAYERMIECTKALDFDIDRLVKTDVRKLMRICQQQAWIKNFANPKG